MITLTSNNPKFSWILRKNPETQRAKNEPFSKSLRKGIVYGWFLNDQQFRMFFHDSATESSFNTLTEFEYLDRTRYCSPYLPIAMIGTLLASAQKEETEEDTEGFVSTLEFIADFSEVRMANRIAGMMPCQINLTELGKSLYHVRMESQKGIRHLLNCAISYLITQAVRDENLYIPMDEQAVKKYIDAMNMIDTDYYVRYNMALKCIRSPNVFASMKDSLENGKFLMSYGNTQQHRFNAIQQQLTSGGTLFDIGCGEMFYVKRLHKRYQNVKAFDADPEIQEHNEHHLKIQGIENVELFGKFDETSDLPSSDTTDVLITEVLEHMPFNDSMKLLNRVCNGNFNKIVITVPNKDFNRFYGLSADESRHPDHHWEPTEDFFVDMFNMIGNVENVNVQYFNVGDGVIQNGKIIRASLGVILTKK